MPQFLNEDEAQTGDLLWSCRVHGRIEGGAAVSECGSVICVGTYDGSLYLVGTLSGRVLRRVRVGGAVKGTPLVLGRYAW